MGAKTRVPKIAAITTDWRPTLPALFKAYGWFIIYFFFIYFLNPLIDGNYFYLKHRPFFGHLLDTQYVLLVLFATFGIFLIGYYASRLIDDRIQRQ